MSNFYVHPQGLCESTAVGEGTRVWAFAHVLPGAVLGRDCNVCDQVFIENDVVVGDRVTIKCGVQLWDGLRIEDDVFIGPNATFTNDPFPRSKQYPAAFERTVVGRGASIGANATILPGVSIGAHAMVGAGAVVTKDVPPYAVVAGNPARILRYANARQAEQDPARSTKPGITPTTVQGVTLHRMMTVSQRRGTLVAGEFEEDIPFRPLRYFVVAGVPAHEVRGGHAHKICHQFLTAVSGSVRAIVDDGSNSEEFVLDSPSTGLYLPPMTWGTQYMYSHDATLLVFASHHYDSSDYIHGYAEFLRARGIQAPSGT